MRPAVLEILSPEESIALKASAGSGKTSNLSLRVVNLLLEGVEPDGILCLTFTNKATNEMYERIIDTLAHLAGGDAPEEREELLMLVEYWLRKGGFRDRHEVLDHLRSKAAEVQGRIVREISRLRVSTIDSFFNSILRLFPFEAGVLPDFRMITESEEEDLYREAYDQFSSEVHSNDSVRQLLTNLVLLSGSAELSPLRLLDGCFRRLLAVRTELEGTGGWSQGLDHGSVRELLDEFGRLRDLDQGLRAEARAFAAGMKETYPELNGQALAELKRYEEARPNSLARLTSLRKERYTEYRPFSSLEYLQGVQEAFLRLKELLKGYLRQKGELFQRTTLLLFGGFLDYSDRAKHALNVLGFNDVTRLCHNLLIGRGLMKENPDYFYFRLDSRIEHLLIDEFQDTSVVQWKILRPITDELTAGIGQKERQGSFFYVGDPKQSIYRFRGGESRLFDTVLSLYPGRLKALSLKRNYRSGRAIVDFVNRLFSHISSRYGYDYEEQEPTLTEEGLVEIRFINRGELSGDQRGAVAELKRETVLSFIEDLLSRGVPPGDIALLCQKNRTCEEYSELLRSHGHSVLTETTEALTARPSVRAMMNLLGWLADPRQTVDLLGFLASVQGLLDVEAVRRLFYRCPHWSDLTAALPDLQGKLERLLSLAGLIPVYRLIERAVEEFDLQRAFGYDPNILRIIGMAASEEISDPLSIDEFIGFLNSRSSLKAHIPAGLSERSVRVMTVHKAKGLEFPYVILPELETSMGFDSRNTPLILDLDDEMAIRGIYLSESREIASLVPELAEARSREEERIMTDCLNHLYVALTRAMEGLMVVAERTAGTLRTSEILYEFLSEGFTDGKREDTGVVELFRTGSIIPREGAPEGEGPAHGRPAPPGPVFLEGLRRWASSRHEAPLTEAEGEEVEGTEGYRERLFGRAFHHAVELFWGFCLDSTEEAVRKVRERYVSLGEEELRSIERRLSLLAAAPDFQRLLKGQQRLHEASFVDGSARHRIDCLVFDGGTVRVMDFKTSSDTPLMEGYVNQLRRYLWIARRCFGDRFPRVEGYLVFAGEDRVVLQRVTESPHAARDDMGGQRTASF